MSLFRTVLATYLIFALAIFLGRPKHIRNAILNQEKLDDDDTAVVLLGLLLMVAVFLTMLEVIRLLVD